MSLAEAEVVMKATIVTKYVRKLACFITGGRVKGQCSGRVDWGRGADVRVRGEKCYGAAVKDYISFIDSRERWRAVL